MLLSYGGGYSFGGRGREGSIAFYSNERGTFGRELSSFACDLADKKYFVG